MARKYKAASVSVTLRPEELAEDVTTTWEVDGRFLEDRAIDEAMSEAIDAVKRYEKTEEEKRRTGVFKKQHSGRRPEK